MREIRMTYTITQADLIEGRQNARHPAADSGGIHILLSLILLITLLYATPALWDSLSSNSNTQSIVRQIVVGGAPWLYVAAWFMFVTKYNRKSQAEMLFKYSPNYHLQHTACINDDGLCIETSSTTTRTQWSMILGITETANLILLYTSGASFYFLPKRGLPAGTDITKLRHCIGERINSLCLSPEEFARQRPDADAPAILPRLHFTLKMADFAQARRIDANNRWLQLAKDAIILIPVYVIFFWLFRTTRLHGEVSLFWIYIGGFVIFVAIQMIMQARHWRHAKHLHGPQSVDITDSGLRFASAAGAQWIGWGAMQCFRQDKKMFVIHLRDGSLRCIPERAFLTVESSAEFGNILNTRIISTAGFAVLTSPPAP